MKDPENDLIADQLRYVSNAKQTTACLFLLIVILSLLAAEL